MAHKGGHHHSHNISQEILVARLFLIGIIVYFLAQLVITLNSYGVLGSQLLVGDGWSMVGRAFAEVWQYRLGPIFIFLDIVCAAIFLYALIKVWPLRPAIKIFSSGHHGHGGGHAAHGAGHQGPKHNPAILKHWTDIVRRANTGTPENLRWSIMESDALVDMALKERGMPGETMADRLANFSPRTVKSLDRLWDAHRLRNEIAHTPGFKITTKQAERALFAFRDFLKELNAF